MCIRDSYNAIQGGEQIVLKVLDDEATEVNPTIGGLFKATFNKDGYVKDLDKKTATADGKMNTSGNKDAGYTLTGAYDSKTAIKLTLKGATLWVTAEEDSDNYVVIDDDCKIFVHTYNDDADEFVEYNTLESAIGALTTQKVNGQTVAYVNEVATICNKTTGYATTLIIYEVKGTTTVVKPSDPATKPEATIVGYTINIPSVNGAPVDTVQGVLEKNGYKLESMQSGACVATKDGVTYYFTINTSDKYYTTTVDGVVVEYKKANAQGTVTAEKAFAGKVGTSYKWTASNGQSGFGTYASAKSAGKIDGIASAAVVIETGYVKVTATAPAGYTVEAPAFVKANSSFTVTVKNASGISADTSITVGKETKSGGTDVKELSFTVSAENGNVTVTATASTVYTITLPDEKTEKGLTISFEGPAKAAKDDTVVVTMKVSGKATDKVTLTLGDKTKLTDIAWNTVATSGMTVDSTNTNKLEIAQGSNYIQPASMQFSFKMIAENVTVSAS